ncbi:alpha/beta hydrolase [soil metagenome]
MAAGATHAGSLPSGSQYLIEVPEDWNGVTLVFSHPVPVEVGEPPWEPDEPLIGHLVDSGYAVAGSANTIFWPLELARTDQPALLDVVGETLAAPRHTIALGLSIGGIMTAGLVQQLPDRLSGALPMCGNLAGAVSIHNRELDIAFVVKSLLAPGSALQIVDITDPYANLVQARSVLKEAQESASGRARLALAAAVGNIPGWQDPASTEPAPDDFAARQRNQFAWYEEVCFLVFFWAREQVERQAGGNPSWNSGVDYRRLLATSINRDEVEALYAAADVDLDEDLDRLASEPRIEADPAALAYLERHVIFSGDLGGVPVLTVHTDGDGLVTPDNERAYAEVVAHAGHQDHLRQLYVHRAGHCTMTVAEILAALDVLIERIEAGRWPDHDPGTMNAAAGRLGTELNVLQSDQRQPMEAGFFDFEPPAFPRRYDIRDRTSV